jgi:hypothetical protein
MLALTLLISNPLSKVYFLEKCGLPLIDGKVMTFYEILLTRFKYLIKNCKHSDPCGRLTTMQRSSWTSKECGL